MAATPKTIHVTDETAVRDLLDAAAEAPVILERGDERFRLSRSDDRFVGYDPERVRDGLRRFAGTIGAEEGERLKELIYQGREDGTRSPDRP